MADLTFSATALKELERVLKSRGVYPRQPARRKVAAAKLDQMGATSHDVRNLFHHSVSLGPDPAKRLESWILAGGPDLQGMIEDLREEAKKRLMDDEAKTHDAILESSEKDRKDLLLRTVVSDVESNGMLLEETLAFQNARLKLGVSHREAKDHVLKVAIEGDYRSRVEGVSKAAAEVIELMRAKARKIAKEAKNES